MKITARRPIRDEKGQALILTLIFLLIGMIILTPLVNFMGTGISSGRVYEQKIDEIYAADAGVEDALWYIRYDQVEDLLGVGYDEYDYSSAYPYPYDLDVNDKDVGVTIQNIWIPKDLDMPSASVARQIIEDEKLLIVGYPSSTESTYEIKIVYDWEPGQDDDLDVETIGLWLSPGFEYDGDCSLDGEPFYTDPVVSLYKGGYAVVWDFASVPLEDFPNVITGPPMVVTFTFEYTGPEGQIPELVSSWVDTTGVTPDITYSWDDSIRLYKIVSEAGGVQIEAYGAKTKFRKLKSTISSDYTVAGNRLSQATATSGNDRYYRNKLYAESDSTTQRIGLELIPESGIVPPGYIPEEAIIEDVYLYWSGWIDYHYIVEEPEEVCQWVFRWPGGWQLECHWEEGWQWNEIPDLKYPSSPTEANLTTLVEESAKVNIAKLDVDDYAQTITADKWQIVNTSDCSGAPDSWVYSCFADITDLEVSGGMTVQEYIQETMKSDGSGDVTFTLGHADEVRNLPRPGYDEYYFDLDGDGQTGYPLATPAHERPGESYQTRYQWSYAGWSLIIFYRSPALKQSQLYLFDDLRYRSYLGGGDDPGFTISGFLAPPVITEEDKSHLTYFVGEGDWFYAGSSIKVNDSWLSDPPGNPEDNVFNCYSNALPPLTLPRNTDGVDVDTFEMPEGCILPYDTSATITLKTTTEIYNLVYIILSFRSELTTGGIITNYSVKVT